MPATPAPATTILPQAPVATIFMFHGMVLGAWATQVPLLRDRLSLAPGALGIALFCISAGALLTMPLTGRIAARLGAAPIIRVGSALACSAFLVAVLSPTYGALCACLFVFGMGYGAVDVAMNAEAVQVEKAAARPILGGVHAMWSVGSFAGSAGGAALLTAISATAQAAALAGLSLAVILWSTFRLSPPPAPEPPADRQARQPWADRRLLLIGALLGVAFAVEGAIADWGGVYLRIVRHIDPAYAALGYSVFSLCMVAMRFAGDRLRGAIGNARILQLTFIAAAGIAAVVLAPSTILAMAGFGLAGFGVANVVPGLFALAGDRGGTAAVSVAATLGYTGVLAGPPIFGAVAQATSLPSAIGLIAVFCCVIAAAAHQLKTQ